MQTRWPTRIAVGILFSAVPAIGLAPASYAASGQGAQKAALYDVTSDPGAWACDQGVTDLSVPTSSFAVWNLASNGTMQVTVSIKGGTPNASYNVWVESNGAAGASCPPGTSSPSNPGAVVTNGSGNGTAHLSFAPVSGASYWLTAWAGSPGGGHSGLRSQIVSPQ